MADLNEKFIRNGVKNLSGPINHQNILSGPLQPFHKNQPLLPLISKIIEKIIHNQTIAFLNDNNILFRYQSGFNSTYYALSFLSDKILRNFDKGAYTSMILIDLTKSI